jgi:hypothetical protein
MPWGIFLLFAVFAFAIIREMPQNARKKKTGPVRVAEGGGVFFGSLEANQEVHDGEVHGLFCACALPIDTSYFGFSCLYTVPKASDVLAAAFSSLGISTSTTEQRGPRLYTAPPLSRERGEAQEGSAHVYGLLAAAVPPY